MLIPEKATYIISFLFAPLQIECIDIVRVNLRKVLIFKVKLTLVVGIF